MEVIYSGDALMAYKSLAITGANNDLVRWRIYVVAGHNNINVTK